MIPSFIAVLLLVAVAMDKQLLSSLLPLQRLYVQFDLHGSAPDSLSRLILALKLLLKHRIPLAGLYTD